MSDAERTKNYFIYKLRKNYQEGKLDTSQVARLKVIGNQFVSLSDAARAVGLRNGNSIRRAIDRGGTAGGYHWEYLDEKKEVSTDDHHQADGRAE